MQSPSDKLFRLIKSLSKSEKGYFLKLTGRSSGEYSGYVKLFNAIDSLKIYDENKIKSILKDEPCIRQLHVAKNYLYKILLKTLYLFSSENSPGYKCSEALGSISSLYTRGLYSECMKEIRKAKVFAYSAGKYDSLLEILRWERNLHLKDTAIPPANISEEELKVSDIIQNLVKYRRLYNEIFSLMREKGSIRNKEEKKLFRNIMSDPLLKNINNALSIEAKMLYYQIYIIYYGAESDDRRSYLYADKLEKFMNSHKFLINDFIKEYVFAVVQKLTSAFNMGKYKKALAISKELRDKKIRSTEQKEYIFYSTYVIELFVYIVDCDFKKGLKIIPHIESELESMSPDEVNAAKLTLFRNIFYIYFALEEYSSSLIWLNKIINANLHTRQDLYSLTHILNLIVHYELKNVDLIHHAVINTYRYLYKRKKIYTFESDVLKFIRRISNISDADQLKEEFRLLKFELNKLVDDPYERIPLQYFDFLSWLESKIKGKSFIEMKTLNKNS